VFLSLGSSGLKAQGKGSKGQAHRSTAVFIRLLG
jgi:hypothetical protein